MYSYASPINSFNEPYVKASSSINIDYCNHVLNPDTTEAVRIPEKFPIPSVLVRDTKIFPVGTNANGAFQIIIPTWTFNSGSTYDNAVYTAGGGTWNDTTTTYLLASGEYVQFSLLVPASMTSGNFTAARLVSKVIKFRHTGSALNTQGFIIVGCRFDNWSDPGVNATIFSSSAVQDMYFSRVLKNEEGVKCIYIPKDNIDYEYSDLTLDAISNKKNMVWYLSFLGQQASSSIGIVEVHSTYECLPTLGQKDLLYPQLGTSDSEEKQKEVLAEVIKRNKGLVSQPNINPYLNIADQPYSAKSVIATSQKYDISSSMAKGTQLINKLVDAYTGANPLTEALKAVMRHKN